MVLDSRRAVIPTGAEVLVFTTESRYLPPQPAADAVTALAGKLPAFPLVVYKKIDSTLRGHPGLELMALMDALHSSVALVAPAFPAQGRTAVAGQLLVRGQPLGQTVFAAQAASGDLYRVFAQPNRAVSAVTLDDVRLGAVHVAELLNRTNECVCIADAETEADLLVLAQAAMTAPSQAPVLCGSAGLAHALAEVIPPAVVQPPAFESRRHGPLLVIAGSRHPATVAQVETARQRGVSVVQASVEFVYGSESAGATAAAELVQAAAEALTAGRDVIVTTARTPDSPLGAGSIASRLGEVVAQLQEQFQVGGLVLTGGDIAAAVCAALEAHSLQLLGEVQPGIALGCLADGACAGLAVVTKAGGFGNDCALIDALAALHHLQTRTRPEQPG